MDAATPQKTSVLDRFDRALTSGGRWLYILFAAAFLLKLLYVIQSAGSLHVNVPIMDSKYYDKEAREIVGGSFIRREAFFMGPLYPYVLSLIYTIFGRDFMIVRHPPDRGRRVRHRADLSSGERSLPAVRGVRRCRAPRLLRGDDVSRGRDADGVARGPHQHVGALRAPPDGRAHRVPQVRDRRISRGALGARPREHSLFLPVVLVWTLFVVREDKTGEKSA